MALNTTGLPNTGDYRLGRGIVYLSGLTSGDKPDDSGWRDLGNAPEFNVSIETETLEHVSSREGLRTVDKELVTQQKMTITFTLDEINDRNLAQFFSGETATHTNSAIAGFAAVDISTSVVLGRWYDLVDSSGERAYDIESADLSLEEGGGSVALVEDTDYTLDLKMGRVFLLSTATNIADGDTLEATLAANAGAQPVEEVRGLTTGNVQVALKFIAKNAANSNKEQEFQFHKTTLRSTGDMALIGEDWATLGFEGTVENAPLADADAPYVRVRDHADA